MTRINPYKTRSGDITYKVRFRLAGRKNPTSETFSGPNAYAEAQKFVALMEQVGPDVARQIRDESGAAPVEVWTLGTWFEYHLKQSYASNRINGRLAWTVDEIDIIADMLGVDALDLMRCAR